MTFRSRPAANRPRNWEDRDRRSALLNIGFALTVVAAILLLVIAVGASWYDDHLASAATVNGQSISKDAFRRQVDINTFRLGYQERRVRTLLTAGRIRTSDAETRLAILDQRKQQLSTISLEQLIDGMIMEQLAARDGVASTDADVDAAMLEEATTPELRHAWMIAVEPALAEGEATPSEEAKTAARAAAAKALADLRAGKSWDEIAKAVSTDATRDQAGDLGFIDENTAIDRPFADALLAVAADTPTEVTEGDDGVFRIGRVTEIIAPVVDATLESQIEGEGIDLGDYRAAIRREVIREKLSDKIVAGVSAPGPQRRVAAIFLEPDANGLESTPGAVRVRHILYAPNDDTTTTTPLDPADPAWAAAEAEARATYDKLKADISQFDALARTDNDDAGSVASGGRYWFSRDDALDLAFHDAIFKDGLQPGQLLEPVKSGFGWHVIQIMHFAPDSAWAAKLKADAEGGADFAKLARDNSDDSQAAEGGEFGWVARGQMDQSLEDAIFATEVGGISEPLTLEGQGTYLFKVLEEQVRAPDADQLEVIESSAFGTWYSEEKAAFTITRDSGVVGGSS